MYERTKKKQGNLTTSTCWLGMRRLRNTLCGLARQMRPGQAACCGGAKQAYMYMYICGGKSLHNYIKEFLNHQSPNRTTVAVPKTTIKNA